jgi:hypothetical protein
VLSDIRQRHPDIFRCVQAVQNPLSTGMTAALQRIGWFQWSCDTKHLKHVSRSNSCCVWWLIAAHSVPMLPA